MNSKFILSVIAVLIVVSAVSGFYIWNSQSARGLKLDIEAPSEVLRGAPFEIKVNFSNNSGAVLENAVLTLSLPEGVVFFGEDLQKNIDNKPLGNIGVESLMQETYKVIILSSDEEKKEFQAALSYTPESLNARFEKNKNIIVGVKSSGVEVNLDFPEQITGGDDFEAKVVYRNTSEIDFSGLELKLDYPPSFSFISASLKPDRGNNLWFLGDLRKNSEGELTIKGNIVGMEGDAFDLKSNLSMRSAGQIYLIDQRSYRLVIASTPLSVVLRLNNESDYIAAPGDNLSYAVSYVNDTEESLRNVVIRAQLIGEMFDAGTVQGGGFFRSSDNTLIWNSSNISALSLLAPGSAGIIEFSVKTKDVYPVRRFGDKNFVLQAVVQAEAEMPNDGKSRVISKAKLETKVRGRITVDAKGYFRDAASGILNYGPFPPKVGQATNFTVHWFLKNFSVEASNIEVSGVLGNNVKIVGEPKSNAGQIPFYDSKNNAMLWRVDRLQANQGIVGDPIEAVFQVEVAPSGADVGTYMTLLGVSSVRALDNFTNKELVENDVPVTTALPDDTTAGQQGGVVQP